jgi:ribosomal protein S3
MGQKTSPIALRLDINRIWDSSWNSPYHYDNLLGREIQLRKYFARVFQRANLLCGRLVIHWNPQSIQIYPFLFPEKLKSNKRKKTKSKLTRRLHPSGNAKDGARFFAASPSSSRIVAQIESQREKTLQKRTDFHKQVLFQRENFVKNFFRFKQQLRIRKYLLPVVYRKPSLPCIWSHNPLEVFTPFSFQLASYPYSHFHAFVLDQSFKWDSKKHLWQRKKYLASWGISSYKKQKIKKAEGNLFAYLSKEKEGKVRKKERIHKKKVLVKKRLNLLKKKRTLAKKKSTTFSNKSMRLHKSFNKLLYKASPQQGKQLFSNQGLTFFGRVFLQRPRKEKLKQKARNKSSLRTPEKPQDLSDNRFCANKKYWNLTKEERIFLLDEKKSNFSNKKRKLLKRPPLKVGTVGKSATRKRLYLPLTLGEKRTGNTLFNVRSKSKALSPRAIRCFIRSIAKVQGYCVVHKALALRRSHKALALRRSHKALALRRSHKALALRRSHKALALRRNHKAKQDKLVVKDRSNKRKTLAKGRYSRFREAAKSRTLPSPAVPAKTAVHPKGIYKLYAPKRFRYKLHPKLLKAHGSLRAKLPSPKTVAPSLVSFQPRILKLSGHSKDFWKKKFSSKKAFLQVSLASAFLSSCWREKLFAIRGQVLHNFFLCESLSLLPTQNLWQKKRNKFKNSTALRYLEEHLQRIYQSQVQILPIKLKSSLPYKAEPVFCYQSALVLAQQLARAIEKKKIRTYRQVVRTALKQAKNISWLQGVRITCSGRLGRVDLAKQETKTSGETSLHVFSKKIDYGFASARTKKVGIVGIKVWLSFV